MKWLLGVVLLLCAACAQMKTTVSETIPATADRPERTTTVEVNYRGTAGGARELVEVEIRRAQSGSAAEVAKAAVAKGLPATLNQDARQSGVQAGFNGWWGAGGWYGMPGAVGVSGSAALMRGDMATFGYGPNLPPLAVPPVMHVVAPPTVAYTTTPAPATPASASSGGEPVAKCPKRGHPTTTAELAACTADQVREITRVLRDMD